MHRARPTWIAAIVAVALAVVGVAASCSSSAPSVATSTTTPAFVATAAPTITSAGDATTTERPPPGSTPGTTDAAPGAAAPVSGCPGAPATSPVVDPEGPHGVYAIVASRPDAATQARLDQFIIPDPTNCGATIVVPWNEIDRGPGTDPQYDWSFIDQLAAPWWQAKKVVNLVFEGVGLASGAADPPMTPDYVTTAVKTVACDGTTGPAVNPVYWDAPYQDAYRAFEAAVVTQYDVLPGIGYLRFGIGAGDEDIPSNGYAETPECKQKWLDAGLTADQWLQFSLDQLDHQVSLHSKHPLVTSIDELDPGDDTLPNAVAARAAADGIGIGYQRFTTASHATKPCAANWCAASDLYRGQVPLELRPLTIDPAELSTLLTFGLSQHAQIFELPPDAWFTAKEPAAPGYPEHHAAIATALANVARAVA